MQTFLPYANFNTSVKCLDDKRLGKQRVEAYQILRVLTGKSKGNAWKNHPAVLMWKGYEPALRAYMNECILQWKERGFVNNMRFANVPINFEKPKWLGDKKFHSSHRSNLLRKNPEWYAKFGWKEPSDLSYVWPSKM
jgi:hypothetical protein